MKRETLPLTTDEYHAHPAFGSGAFRRFMLGGNAEFWHVDVARKGTSVDEDASWIRNGSLFAKAMESPDSWRESAWIIPKRTPKHDEPGAELLAAINEEMGARPPGQKTGKGPAPILPDVPLNFNFPTHQRFRDMHKQMAADAGKTYLTDAEHESLNMQIASVWDNVEIYRMLEDKSHMNVEVCTVATLDNGLQLKALEDLVLGVGEDSMGVDFKTTRESTPYRFLRDAWKRGYRWQAAFYCYVTGRKRFRFISVRNAEPYEANVFEVPPKQLAANISVVKYQVECMAQLINQSQMDDADCQGMPVSYHNELWGTVLPMDIDMLQRREEAA